MFVDFPIVDFHTHTFPEKIAAMALRKLQSASHLALFSDGTAAGLRQSMARAGVRYSVVLPVATSPRQVASINASALRANADAPQTGVFSLGAMHPDDENWEAELERLAEGGVRGVKLHPPYQQVDFCDPRYVRILKKMGKLGLFAVVHAGLDVGLPDARQATPDLLRRAADAAPDTLLVLAHMGGWRRWEEAERLLKDTQVCLDTSFSLGRITPSGDGDYRTAEDRDMLSEKRFVGMVRSFGAQRILFGTDSPWTDQAAEVRKILALPLTTDEQKAILGQNALRLLRL